MRHWIPLLAGASLTLAACGDDVAQGTAASSSTTLSSTTTESPPTTGIITSEGDELPALPITEDFCDFVDESEAIANALQGETDENGARLLRFLSRSAGRALELAPPEVLDDFTVVAEGFQGFVELVEEYGGDISAAFESGDPRAFPEAGDGVEDRLNAFCDGED